MDEKLKAYFSKLGRKSGKARMKKISPAKRSQIAARAAKARWSRRKKGGQAC